MKSALRLPLDLTPALPRALAVATVAVVASVASGCALEQPFSGPGYENGALTTDAPGPFIVATTLLDVKDDGASDEVFSANMDAINEALPKQKGFVGASLSGKLLSNDENRTLSVWESEEDMLAWVVSDVHARAMQEFVGHAERGTTTTWTITRDEMPPTWEDARERLDADGRDAY